MTQDEIFKLLSNAHSILPWLVFVSGGLLILWKQFRNPIRAFLFLLDLYSNASKENIRIIEELYKLSRAKNEFEIRHQLAESRLRIAIYICDIKGSCIYVNDYLCEMWGMEKEDMLGFGWLAAIIEEDRIHTRDLWIDSVNKNVPYSTEYKIVNMRTQEVIDIKTKAYCVKNMKDEPICYMGYVEKG